MTINGVIVAFGLMLAHSCGFATDLREQMTPCSPMQKAALDNAHDLAKSTLSHVIATLESPTEADLKRQEKWFGVMSSASAEQLRMIYMLALARAFFTQYWCPSSNSLAFKWDRGDIAAVHPNAPSAMFFTPDFFKLTTAGADSQMGTIIHELTHLVGVGFRPEVYGTTNAKALATRDPSKAKNNSDNFQYYAEDLTFGVP